MCKKNLIFFIKKAVFLLKLQVYGHNYTFFMSFVLCA